MEILPISLTDLFKPSTTKINIRRTKLFRNNCFTKFKHKSRLFASERRMLPLTHTHFASLSDSLQTLDGWSKFEWELSPCIDLLFFCFVRFVLAYCISWKLSWNSGKLTAVRSQEGGERREAGGERERERERGAESRQKRGKIEIEQKTADGRRDRATDVLNASELRWAATNKSCKQCILLHSKCQNTKKAHWETQQIQ